MSFSNMQDQNYLCAFCQKTLVNDNWSQLGVKNNLIYVGWFCHNHSEVLIEYLCLYDVGSDALILENLFIDFEQDISIMAKSSDNTIALISMADRSKVNIPLPWSYLDLTPEEMRERAFKLLTFL